MIQISIQPGLSSRKAAPGLQSSCRWGSVFTPASNCTWCHISFNQANLWVEELCVFGICLLMRQITNTFKNCDVYVPAYGADMVCLHLVDRNLWTIGKQSFKLKRCKNYNNFTATIVLDINSTSKEAIKCNTCQKIKPIILSHVKKYNKYFFTCQKKIHLGDIGKNVSFYMEVRRCRGKTNICKFFPPFLEPFSNVFSWIFACFHFSRFLVRS